MSKKKIQCKKIKINVKKKFLKLFNAREKTGIKKVSKLFITLSIMQFYFVWLRIRELLSEKLVKRMILTRERTRN